MKVTLVDKMGTDLTVVNAARVSYAKTKEKFDDKDKKLISYLAKHNHWSPFAHASLQFRIKAPIFVARQLVKHQVGLSWNEVSRRYVNYTPELYDIETWRGKPENSKQGSGGEIKLNRRLANAVAMAMKKCTVAYVELIEKGVAPEMARAVLPQSMMTEWYWTGSLMAFARVCNLRCKPDAQLETRIVANLIDQKSRDVAPISWKELRK